MNMNGSSRGQDKKPFCKAVKTSSRVYGDGPVYFCDGSSVIQRDDYEYFDFETGEHDDCLGVSYGLRNGVVIALGPYTGRRYAIAALRKVIHRLSRESRRSKCDKGR